MIGRLEGEGFVVRNGRTVLVQDLTLTAYLEIIHVRRLLECEAAGLAPRPRRIAKADLLNMRNEVETSSEDAGAEAHWMGDSKIHDMIVRASDNDLLAHNVGALRRRTLLFGRYRLSGRLRNGQAEHLAIIDAILAEDREATQSAMRTTWT